MAINRRLAMIIIAVAVLAVAATSQLIAWMSPLQVGITRGADLSITDVQFEKDYLNITVENICTQAKVISEVTVSYQGSVIESILLYEPISVGEQISIRISFKWTSGHTYEIRLETADITDWSPSGIYITQAP